MLRFLRWRPWAYYFCSAPALRPGGRVVSICESGAAELFASHQATFAYVFVEPHSRQLDEMQLMHRQFAELAQASLAAANLPSRSDFEALDERMGRLEDGLAQVAAALSQLSQAIAAQAHAAQAAGLPANAVPTRPARTRRPPQLVAPAPAPTGSARAPAAVAKSAPAQSRRAASRKA
jgi:hypothetical protein